MENVQKKAADFELFLTESAVEFMIPTAAPELKSAITACVDAIKNQGSLIRVTSKDRSTAKMVGSLVITYLEKHKHLKTEEFVTSSQDGWPIIELANGSGIELAVQI